MAANPCNAETLMVSVTHGAFSYGVPIAISYELSVQDVVIRGEGVVGPSCPAIVAKDLVAVCTFLVKPPQNSDVTPANLVITNTMADGNVRTHTLASMTTRGFSYEFARDNAPALYRQTFRHVGNMSVNGVGTLDVAVATVA